MVYQQTGERNFHSFYQVCLKGGPQTHCLHWFVLMSLQRPQSWNEWIFSSTKVVDLNFYLFQFLKGASDDLLSESGLSRKVDDYIYLRHGRSNEVRIISQNLSCWRSETLRLRVWIPFMAFLMREASSKRDCPCVRPYVCMYVTLFLQIFSLGKKYT